MLKVSPATQGHTRKWPGWRREVRKGGGRGWTLLCCAQGASSPARSLPWESTGPGTGSTSEQPA